MNSYFEKYKSFIYPLDFAWHESIEVAIIIPIFNEENLWDTLASVKAQRTDRQVRIVIVLNHPHNASESIKNLHLRQADEIATWINRIPPSSRLQYTLIELFNASKKLSGVGNARKTGMDSMVYWLKQNHHLREVVLVNLDADCLIHPDYIDILLDHYHHNKWNGCSIHFEHRRSEGITNAEWIACQLYEIHLRLYIGSMRLATYPLAFQTVGSAMACTSSAYLSQGGMVRNEAGEDFYFIQKLLPLGKYADLPVSLVYPSARSSDRVPFGTGKAINNYLTSGQQYTYHPDSYRDIYWMCRDLPKLYEFGFIGLFSEVFTDFLNSQGIEAAYDMIKSNTSDFRSFRKRWFTWFNNFRVMKWLHYARSGFPDLPVMEAIEKYRNLYQVEETTPENILLELRKKDSESGMFLDKNFNVRQL